MPVSLACLRLASVLLGARAWLGARQDCRYAWGDADVAQVWGDVYFANHEIALANRAVTQALTVRRRIEPPGVAEIERWLGPTS